MTTARDLITQAFKEAGILGVGQDLLAQDVNDGLSYLNQMLAQWQTRRWLVPALTTVNALGNGQVSNTIGPSGHWDVTPRPDQILSGYVVQVNTGQTPVSLQLSPIDSRENYNLIAVKELNTLPNYYFYDNDWESGVDGGLGNVYLWPVPSSQYRIYLTVKKNLNFPNDDLNEVFALPPQYEEAIRTNLAIRICSAYGRLPLPTTIGLAKVALNTIKKSNAQIFELQMPTGLVKGRAFNIYNPDGY